MKNWFKKSPPKAPEPAGLEETPSKQTIFNRFKKGLSKTRTQFGEGLSRLLLGKKVIDYDIIDDLETLLISADFGLKASQSILSHLSQRLKRNELNDGQAILLALKQE